MTNKTLRKFVLVLVASFMLGGAESFASEQIQLVVGIYKPRPIYPGMGKAPMQAPQVWQDGYELTFQSSHPEYTLELLQDGAVVYSAVVSTDATAVILPSWLEGSYEIELQTDSNYYFYGIINL